MEQTFNEVTRSVDQLCNQFSMMNLAVPKFENSSDVFDFLAEFENLTASLVDEQKAKLLFKAFPPGRYRAWFETELKPAITIGSSWSELKSKMIQRFSSTEDRDRHFSRLHKLKFNPNGSQKLLDYVEDVIYSYRRAYNSNFDEEACVRFIKTSLPSELLASLNMNQEFKSSKGVKELTRAVKNYDDSRAGFSSVNNNEKLNIGELTSILKELINKSSKDHEKVVAAIQALPDKMPQYRPVEPNRDRSSRPFERRSYRDRVTPNNSRDNSRERYFKDRPRSRENSRDRYEHRQSYSHSNDYPARQTRAPSPRPTSPGPSTSKQYYSPSPNRRPNRNDNNHREYEHDRYKVAYDDKAYFDKFGVPPTSCPNCGAWHWARHCVENLN